MSPRNELLGHRRPSTVVPKLGPWNLSVSRISFTSLESSFPVVIVIMLLSKFAAQVVRFATGVKVDQDIFTTTRRDYL